MGSRFRRLTGAEALMNCVRWLSPTGYLPGRSEPDSRVKWDEREHPGPTRSAGKPPVILLTASVPPLAPLLNQQHSQALRAVGAEDEDALDVAGAAGAGDEADEAGVVALVFEGEAFVGGG